VGTARRLEVSDMIITKDVVSNRLLAYLNREITLEQLVYWAESVMCDGELAEQDAAVMRDVVARIGLADVRDFGLSWDDCYEFLSRLGYKVQVNATPVAV
jgi:hypothetical protein